jgi:transcriptional regulator
VSSHGAIRLIRFIRLISGVIDETVPPRHLPPSTSGEYVKGRRPADEPANILRGTLDTVILRALQLGPMHGFEITTWLEHRSGGTLAVEDGALYHALVRLEKRELIDAEWGVTENNRRARYYRLTAKGRHELKAQAGALVRYARALTRILADNA